MALSPGLVGADLLMRIGIDASGVDAEIASRLTRAERAAVASGDRIAAGVSRGANTATAAQLRVVAATEKYNAVLRKEGATQGQIASAQASVLTARRAAAREMDREATAAARLNTQTRKLGNTARTFIGASAGFAAFSFFRGGLQEVKDYQAGLAQTRAGIQSTGRVANVSAKDVQALAGAVQDYSGFTDDSVVSASNLLLTFTKVRNEVGRGNDVFDQAIKRSADLQARGFGDLETSAKTLGKALNDPVRGLTALSRAGVQFTDEQKETIKGLVETGDMLGAQRIVLRELETQVGGSARAFGRTLPGSIERSRRSLEDFEQGVVTTIAPALQQLTEVTDFFSGHDTARSAALWGAGIIGGLVVVNKGVKLYGEISQNILRRTPQKIIANDAVARSYDRIAGAAGRAAVAEGKASSAGIGGAAGRAGFLGLGVAGGVATGIGAAVIGGSYLLNAGEDKVRQQRQQRAAQNPASVRAELARTEAQIAAMSGTPGARSSIYQARAIGALQGKADQLRAALREAAKEQRKGADAAKDQQVSVTTSRGQIEVSAAAMEKLRTEAREFAEIDPFAGAIRKKDRKDALSPEDVLKRVQNTLRRQTNLRDDLTTIAGRGASAETLSLLKGLEAEAPGTIARIADDSGKKFRRTFEDTLNKLNRRTSAIESMFVDTTLIAERQGSKAGRAFIRGFRDSVAAQGEIIDYKQGGFQPYSAARKRDLPTEVHRANIPTP